VAKSRDRTSGSKGVREKYDLEIFHLKRLDDVE
jgi:hypothetical protein